MGLFSSVKKKSSKGSINTKDEILGYLDEIISRRVSFNLNIGRKVKSCRAYELNDSKSIIRIEDTPGLSAFNGKNISVGFPLDKNYFVFKSKLIFSENKPYLKYPDSIDIKDRRSSQRTTLAVREGGSVSILESLGKGVGINGVVKNIGTGGLFAKITRAIVLEREQEIRVNDSLLKPGQQVALIRVKDVAGLPLFDCSGEIVRFQREGDWHIAVRFKSLSSSNTKLLEKFLNYRCSEYKKVNRSRKKNEERLKERERLAKERENQSDVFTPPPKKTELKKESVIVKEEAKKNTRTNINAIEQLLPRSLECIVYGDGLYKELDFFDSMHGKNLLKCESMAELMKVMRIREPDMLFVPLMYKDQNVLELLEKLNSLKLLDKVKILLFSPRGLEPKEILKCKTLGVRGVMSYPVEDLMQLLQKIITVLRAN